MQPSSTSPLATLNGVARLDHLGVIQIEGEDAAKFIHGQLTHDFALLDLGSARLAAFCSAKGRMQASFIGFKRPAGDILLVCSRDLLAPTLKRLSMFVMRAKAKLSDASERFSIYGLLGNATKNVAANAGVAWAKADFDAESVVQLYPADGTPRQLWVAPVGTAVPQGEALALETWLWSEVRSGVATLSQPVFEAFVPQMLNYESVGGVSFKKGCYPGQEVVARSQFRGTLKRRAFVVHSAGELQVGQEIFTPADTSQPVGTVVQAARAPGGGMDAIVSLQLAALETGPLLAADSELQLLPLPYLLLEDI
ncbi:MAG: folate-binding protein [Curvibacter sp. RIFCSPHIGHO2_12_FULL_63_18]|uniref:CAF17-like 4Fe-4S cluster assembly/insertion protein YgfZ n=1 Tax=Rhodoferax sp. TaxID=50421 RepID=UPI0008B69BE4|nr:folate-binding protein [Rhodoferax sp.]OGO97071.1 MAG: folate-binding protein [Curvibacter sp. GWA2_63_95]OGP01408.1 MAG: folate-binding protein [Curvibacter sp. RIFCSPHIGHO2_12_FULL_63_18]HCX80645.1 folate-binding protein YgfZ [Rhodoferax sp.]